MLLEHLVIILTIFGARATLIALTPVEIAQEVDRGDGIMYELMQFGHFQWGSSLQGGLRYVDVGNCSKFKGFNNIGLTSTSNFIMIKEPKCPITSFAKYAQIAGAKLLIIIDQKGYDLQKIKWTAHPSASDAIHIPVIRISSATGEIIIPYIESDSKDDESTAFFEFTIKKPKAEIVPVELWMMPGSIQSYNALAEVASLRKKIEAFAVFTPRYLFFHNDQIKFHLNPNDCLESGTACMFDPDKEGPLNGRLLLQEAIRQICVWENDRDGYWEYMKEFPKRCFNPKNDTDFGFCSRDLLAEKGISVRDIDKCYKNSFQNDEQHKSNIFLNSQIEANRDFRIKEAPTFVVNDFIVEEFPQAMELLDLVCENLNEPPGECVQVMDTMKKQRIWHFITILLVIFIFFVAVFYITYRLIIKKQIEGDLREPVQAAVTKILEFQTKEQDNQRLIV